MQSILLCMGEPLTRFLWTFCVEVPQLMRSISASNCSDRTGRLTLLQSQREKH